MIIHYSKPSSDIQIEGKMRLENDPLLHQRQAAQVQDLLASQDRKCCVLCGQPLTGEQFRHREISAISCSTCGHVQTTQLPPPGYPEQEFHKVYPKLTSEGYEDRKKRIYKPKLDWALNCLQEIGYSFEQLKELKWTEMGCGAGYFLTTLQDAGLKHFTGFDADNTLVGIARSFTKEGKVQHYDGLLSDAFSVFPADIYVAFFVLEHIPDAHRFFDVLKSLPKGTIFIFSIPVFGFSCLLENIFTHNFARNFDGVLHTQLYTDRSIAYAMERSGFTILAQWIFGQDAADFSRFLINNLSEKFSQNLLAEFEKKLLEIQDPLQSCLDKSGLADQRHLIAIKR